MTTLEFKYHPPPEDWEGPWRGGPPENAIWPTVVPIVSTAPGDDPGEQVGWAGLVSAASMPVVYETDIDLGDQTWAGDFRLDRDLNAMPLVQILLMPPLAEMRR